MGATIQTSPGERARDLLRRPAARRVNAVVIGNQNPHSFMSRFVIGE